MEVCSRVLFYPDDELVDIPASRYVWTDEVQHHAELFHNADSDKYDKIVYYIKTKWYEYYDSLKNVLHNYFG